MKNKRLFWLASTTFIGLALLAATWGALRATATAHTAAPCALTLSPLDVVINEVAWMGTEAYFGDEWIELHNTTACALDLDDWTLSDGDDINVTLSGVIAAGGYYLLERDDDTIISDVLADLTYGGNLSNDGEPLTLRDATGAVIDTANVDGVAWPAGNNTTKHTMERVDPTAPDSASNWADNDGLTRNGHDDDGNAINGTPRAHNSTCVALPSPYPHLSVVKSGPLTATPGSAITYTLRLSNTGLFTASAVRLTDVLPAALHFITQTSPCTFNHSANQLVWTIGDLPTTTAPLLITITAQSATTAAGKITNLVTATRAATGTLRCTSVATWTTRIVALVAPRDVVINEVAWMGTDANVNDEWIELHNTTSNDLDLDGWTLSDGDDINIALGGVITAGGYYLLERNDDNVVSDVLADLIYYGPLVNSDETLTLRDAIDTVIDTANAGGGSWPAGDTSPIYTMERIDPIAPDITSNWADNDGIIYNGRDANDDPINGTPRARNSVYVAPPSLYPNLSLAKVGPYTIIAGGALTYTLRLSNTGLLAASDVRLTDVLPAALHFVAQTSPYGFSRSGNQLAWTIGDLPTTTAPLSITITAQSATTASGKIINIVTATRAATGTLRIDSVATWTTRVVTPPVPFDVVINEVAWMGTEANSDHEWIELHNTTASDLDLDGWTLSDGDDVNIALGGVISAGGYYLLERSLDDVVSDIPADLLYGGNIANGGEILTLRYVTGAVIDTANKNSGGWPAGDVPTKHTMERVTPTFPDIASNWADNDGITRNGHDDRGNPINGTPGKRNSAYVAPPSPQADLDVRKNGPPTVLPGGDLTYTLRLSNTGLLTASAVRLSDTLPPTLAFLSQKSPYTFSHDGQALHWIVGELPPLAPAFLITVSVHVSAAAWGSVANVVTATTSASETISANNVSRWTTHIASRSDVLIAAAYYDGYQTNDMDEAVQLVNVGATPVHLTGWQLATASKGAALPTTTLAPGQSLWIAQDGEAFAASFGFTPTLDAGDLDGAWPRFANDGDTDQDEVILRDAEGNLADVLIYETGNADVGGWIGPSVQPYAIGSATGQILYRIRDEVTGLLLIDTHTAADWAQNMDDHVQGRRVRYPGWEDWLFWPLTATESASLTLAVAPDAAYDLVYQTITRATTSIVAASYTLEHARLAEALAAKASQGVSVTVLLEGEPAGGGLGHQERWACQQIEAAGGQCWFMHNYAHDRIYDRYNHMHAKYIVVDGAWVLVGTENLNATGLPDDDKSDGTLGRRGVYALTNAPSVVAFVGALFAADLDPAHHDDVFRWQDAPHVVDSPVPTDTFGRPPFGFMPDYSSGGTSYPAHFGTPLTLTGHFTFELFTSPDAALRQRDALLGLLDPDDFNPGDEVCVEMLYERMHWGSQGIDTPASAPNLRLEAYIEAARRGARVRILLDSRFDNALQSWNNAAAVNYVNQIARDEPIDLQARLGDPTGAGIHNKMVLVRVGGRGVVHVGSLNGSEASNKINRELVLQVHSDEAYAYLKTVFDWDWHISRPLYLPLLLRDWSPPDPPVGYALISEALYNPPGAEDGGEWVEIYNPTEQAVSLTGWRLGDVGPAGEYGSGLYAFPVGTRLPAGGVIVVARQAQDLAGYTPDFEFLIDALRDDPNVPNMTPAGSWDGFGFALGNTGDEVILLDAAGNPIDVLVYGSGSFPGVIAHPGVSASNHSLERRPAIYDTDDCSQDFFDRYPPEPGEVSVEGR